MLQQVLLIYKKMWGCLDQLGVNDKEGLKKSLDVLIKWCEEWGVKINVGKSGIMQ